MPSFKLNSEIIIGITLLAFGAFTFAKGASEHISNDTCIKTVQQVSNLANTVSTANQICGNIISK
jgi:hypothetical protein